MNVLKVKKLHDLKKQIKDLQSEEDILVKELKDDMLHQGLKETVIGGYRLQLQTQDRSTYQNTIIPYLKESGHSELIVESFDQERLKQLEKLGAFNEAELRKHRLEKLIQCLYIKQL